MSTENKSLFPTRDTVKEVVQEGLAMLPITRQNDLVALLHLHGNTVTNQVRKQP